MTDIVLFSCNDILGSRNFNQRIPPPLGLFHLKGVLDTHAFSSVIVRELGTSIGNLAMIIQKFGAKAIGISASGHHQNILKTVVEGFADLGLPIVVGGYISLLGRSLMEGIPSITVAFRGEAEERAPIVFQLLLEGNNTGLGGLPGVLFRQGETIIDTGEAPRIRDLSRYQPDLSYFAGLNNLSSEEDGYFYASRGCFNHCTFCSIPKFIGPGIVETPPEMIGEWIDEAVRLNPRLARIFFTDDEFLYREGRLHDISDALQRHGLKIVFQTRARDILTHREEISRYKHLIHRVDIGIESFSLSQLKRWGKNTTPEENFAALRFLTDHGIHQYQPYLMFYDEKTTSEELRENVEGLLSLPPMKGIHFYHLAVISREFPLFDIGAMADVRGKVRIPKNIRICRDLLTQSKKALDLRKAYVRSYLQKSPLQFYIQEGARALYASAVLATDEASYSKEAPSHHVRMRRLLRRITSGPRYNKQSLLDKHIGELEGHISWTLGVWKPRLWIDGEH